MVSSENILFNALKHHRGYIRQQLEQANTVTLPDILKVLGNSQMDIYYGELDLSALFEEVIKVVDKDEGSYLNWLKAQGGYAEITLSDTSRWVLLYGTEPGKYIHLHPARYSPHSLRVKATVLKIAMAMIVSDAGTDDLETLNAIRVSMLQLSPVKNLEQCGHLWKVMEMLTKENIAIGKFSVI
jgi:hypothetical protein